MKKVTLILIMVIASISMFAQTIVDTTSQNKNVVLEEFTGIHCGYCPQGHAISNQIAAAHPNDFWAINIHVGGYATPGTGEPDFRTPFGSAIAGQSGLVGYPAGTVNRHLFSGHSQGSGTAQSRGDWAATTTTTLGQVSYVNLASTATIDLSTRVMTILVEGYFTGANAPSSMLLNVALLQNNIEGPQSGMSGNPGQVLPNGKYNHMHMLRDMITGQWGETIDTTTQGHFFSRTYIDTIPTAINGVNVELGDVEIITFITETHQEIITGAKAVMSYITPPGINIVDLSIEDMSAIPTLCGSSFTPTVKIKNLSTSVDADTFNVQYSYNAGTPVTQLITTTLNAGDSVTVTFPAVSISAKANNFGYSVDVNSVFHLLDMNTGNNSAITPEFYLMPSATMGTTHTEGFESYNLGTRDIDHTIIENPTGERAFVVDQGISSAVTWKMGGFGYSDKSYRFDNYTIAAGKSINIMFEKLDFSGTKHGVKFNYAYAQYKTSNDKLEIKASDNCGATWTTVWSKAGSALKTHPPVSNARFYPKAADWKVANIDLSAFDGKSEVIIAFVGTSDYGNDLYIDDINIYDNTTIGIETTDEAVNDLKAYPIPADNDLNIEFSIESNAMVSYSLINNLGQIVMTEELGSLNAGQHTKKLDVSNLAQGFYMLTITVDGKTTTKKVSIQ